MEEVEQICRTDRNYESQSCNCLRHQRGSEKVIKTGHETITVRPFLLPRRIWLTSGLFPVFDLHCEEQILTVQCTGARHNLILLNYLQGSQDVL